MQDILQSDNCFLKMKSKNTIYFISKFDYPNFVIVFLLGIKQEINTIMVCSNFVVLEHR